MADGSIERPASMKCRVLVAAIAGLALINGTPFSPVFDPLFFLIRPFAPGFLSYTPAMLFYFTSVLLSLATLLLAGVPAAIYERIRRLQQSSLASLGIWLVAAFLLTLPTLMAVAGQD